EHPSHPPHPPETTTRSVQNIVLGVGVIVLSAAIGLTFISHSLSGGGLAVMLGILTVVAIAMPFVMHSRGLITTAEWLAAAGLLLVLVDGEQLWPGIHGVSAPLYAGLVCAVAAGVAAVYQRFTGLAVPRFAAILLIQPIPALMLNPWMHDLVDWA